MGLEQVRYLAIPVYRPNAIMRFLRVRDRSFNKKEYRFDWGSIDFRYNLGIKLYEFDTDVTEGSSTWSLSLGLGFCRLWFHLPKQLPRRSFAEPGQRDMRGWGIEFATDFNELYVQWKDYSTFVPMPWSLEFHHKDVFMSYGAWLREPKNKYRDVTELDQNLLDHIQTNRYQETVPYRYILSDGKKQKVSATVMVDEMQWRRRWLPWTSLFARTVRSIEVQFSEGIGERADSWKGGTIGCGYEMRQDEDPIDTLRRMERDRKFG